MPDKDAVARARTVVRRTGQFRPLWLGGRSPSAVEVAPAAAAVRLRPELALQLHQAPDPGAVGAEVRLDVGGQLVDGGQVDAEQLRAPLQRCRDRPAQVWSCQVPTRAGYRTDVRDPIGNATDRNR